MFAAVAVFVAAFIIQNTFRIIVRQRQRELALMRAVGATGGQVVWMVAIEALIVGIFASVLGIALGFVISALLTAGMAAIGFDLPSTSASLAPRTIIVGFIVGVGVTLIAAILPAIRAARIPPVAALQDVDVRLRMSDRRRTIFGSVLLVIGVGLIMAGLFGDVLDLGPLNELSAVGIRGVGRLLGGQHVEFADRAFPGTFHRMAAAEDRQSDRHSRHRQCRTETTPHGDHGFGAHDWSCARGVLLHPR